MASLLADAQRCAKSWGREVMLFAMPVDDAAHAQAQEARTTGCTTFDLQLDQQDPLRMRECVDYRWFASRRAMRDGEESRLVLSHELGHRSDFAGLKFFSGTNSDIVSVMFIEPELCD